MRLSRSGNTFQIWSNWVSGTCTLYRAGEDRQTNKPLGSESAFLFWKQIEMNTPLHCQFTFFGPTTTVTVAKLPISELPLRFAQDL